GSNVIEIPADMVKSYDFDVIMYQSVKNYLVDQYEILTPAQRRLPRVYLEHNTPLKSPFGTRHTVNDRRICLVHVTHYNRLMWDNNRVYAHHLPGYIYHSSPVTDNTNSYHEYAM
ncbi:MAG: glycosyltransferase, partial [Bacteroidetes bacterium]|nr:glycosyltransferase [Bacteroidota bacterium]